MTTTRWQDFLTLLSELWKGLNDPDHVLFSLPNIHRYFACCTTCGRTFMHYWGCVSAKDRERGRRVGCHCGGMEFKVRLIPAWKQCWFLFSRYLWRKLVKREQYWDPRIAERLRHTEPKAPTLGSGVRP